MIQPEKYNFFKFSKADKLCVAVRLSEYTNFRQAMAIGYYSALNDFATTINKILTKKTRGNF